MRVFFFIVDRSKLIVDEETIPLKCQNLIEQETKNIILCIVWDIWNPMNENTCIGDRQYFIQNVTVSIISYSLFSAAG